MDSMLVMMKGFLFLAREARMPVVVVDDVRSLKREARRVGARLRLRCQRGCDSARLLLNRAL
jgi:hypothetical protein